MTLSPRPSKPPWNVVQNSGTKNQWIQVHPLYFCRSPRNTSNALPQWPAASSWSPYYLGPLRTFKHNKLPIKLLLYKLLLVDIWKITIGCCQHFKHQPHPKIPLKSPTYNFRCSFLRHKPHSQLWSQRAVYVTELAKTHYNRFNNRLAAPLISDLSSNTIPGKPKKWLKRQWCRDRLTL